MAGDADADHVPPHYTVFAIFVAIVLGAGVKSVFCVPQQPLTGYESAPLRVWARPVAPESNPFVSHARVGTWLVRTSPMLRAGQCMRRAGKSQPTKSAVYVILMTRVCM